MKTDSLASYLLAATTALEACGGSNVMPVTTPPVQRADKTVPVVPDANFVPSTRDAVECRLSGTREKIMTCCIQFDATAATSGAKPVCWHGSPGEMEERHKNNLLVLPNGRQVVGYPEIKDQVVEGDYVAYLMRKLDSAEDVVHLIDQIITYTEDKDNLLYPALETLRNGSGDCDNMSNLAKFLLLELGKKEGRDYEPRIVTLKGSNHAVLVFRDSDGRWKSLDQHPPLTVISDDAGHINLLSASTLFKKPEKDQASFREVVQLDNDKNGRGALMSFGIEPRDLKPDGSLLTFFTTNKYDEKRDPATIVPSEYLAAEFTRGADWKKVKDLELQFGDATIFYANGTICQFQRNQEIWTYNNGRLDQKDFKNPESPIRSELFDQATGSLTQRNYRNGMIEFFRNGRVFQRQYKTGDVEVEHFNESGVLQQRDYRDGHVEWYNPEGKVIQKKDKRGHVEVIH